MVPVTESKVTRIPRTPLQTTQTGHRKANARKPRKAGIRAKNEREDARIIGGAIRRLIRGARGGTPHPGLD